MSGMIATVLLRSRFTDIDSGMVTEILRRHFDRVTQTRRGRHWEFTVSGASASLSVFDTMERAYDFQDDLLRNGLLFDDAPDALLLCIGTRRECDREAISAFTKMLSSELNGVDCGIAT